MTQKQPIHIIGGGLAGSEAAWKIATADAPVVVHEAAVSLKPLQVAVDA